MNLELVGDFAIALFIGALMGVEREKRIAEKGFGIGGIRTFVLMAEAGAVAAWLTTELHAPWIFAAALVVVSAMVMGGYLLQARSHPDSLGLTTEVAAVVTFLLGGVTLFGHREIAVALGILNSALLAYRTPLHTLVGRIGQADLYAALKLLIATFIVLPLLPDRTIDPWGVVNPYKAWVLVILISGMSLLGYVAMRWLGPARGTALTGLFGGLVSSTAVSLSFARESRDAAAASRGAGPLAAGLALSWAVMFVRVLVILAVVFPPLLRSLAVPFGAMLAVCVVAAALLMRGGRAGPPGRDVPLQNPFSLKAAIQFAAFFTFVMLVVKGIQSVAPGQGVYAVAALAGLTDADVIALSMAQMARDSAAVHVAALAIVIAVVANTVAKCGIVAALGSRALTGRVAALTLFLLAVAAVAVWFFPPAAAAISP
ncbi:MAG: hypothetical protein BWK77_00715 [Verrucomicrobia bacterium A1]|nr:MAG: hypothetical protein BWK77_00715 [Verrucomicrobia bacterium A1]